jgi:hypothetical protein
MIALFSILWDIHAGLDWEAVQIRFFEAFEIGMIISVQESGKCWYSEGWLK